MDRRQFMQAAASAALGTPLLARAAPPATLRMVYFHDFPPLSWEPEQQPVRGIFIDALNAIATQIEGLQVTHQTFPWARAQALVREGGADGFVTIPTPKRLEFTAKTDLPLIDSAMKIYTSRQNPRLEELKAVKSPAGLEAFRGGFYIGHGWAESNLDANNITWTRTNLQALKMLALNRVDYSVDVEPVARYHVSKEGFDDKLLVLPQSMGSITFHLMISKASPAFVYLDAINQALARMYHNGQMEALLERYY